MEESHIRALCFLFLRERLYINKSSPLTLKSYDSDFRQMFYTNSPLLLPLLKTTKNTERPFKELKNITAIPKKVRLRNQLENHIKRRLENMSSHWTRLSPASQNRKLAAAKALICWLFENKYIPSDFRHLYKSPRLCRKTPLFLSVDETFCILKTMENSKQKERTKRDMCLFYLLYGGGLRVSEACHLRNSKIQTNKNLLEIRSKGGKPRLVPLPSKAMQHIRNFQKPTKYFFGQKPFSERLAFTIIRKWGEKAGLLRPLHPHALRHSFATHILTGGASLRALQELLGHKTLSATQKYTHLDLSHLAKTLENFHPLNQKKTSA